MKRSALVFTVTVIVAGLSSPAYARKSHRNREAYYQNKWCAEHGGRAEVVLSDSSRCDCITEKNAIEFDFANKWAEAIGQALHYGVMTGKGPGIVLILSGPQDEKYVDRVKSVAEKYQISITVWTVDE